MPEALQHRRHFPPDIGHAVAVDEAGNSTHMNVSSARVSA
jgi:hypothetical protein